MLYRTLLIFLLASLVTPCFGKDFEPFAGPTPLAILVQQNPTDDVIGAETPCIAIYENGDVIYSRTALNQKHNSYFYAKLDFEALSDLTEHLRSVTELSGLKRFYSVAKTPDAGLAVFYLHVDNREVITSVHGLDPAALRDDTNAGGSDPLPVQLSQLYRYLCTVAFSESQPWHPALVEAMIWPDDDTSDAAVPWPKEWPDLNSDRVIQRSQGYSIFLDGSEQKNLEKFLAEKNIVEINGRKWSVAWRPVFPSEPVWRKTFSQWQSN